jgi:riboflavin biosynthesis pyrimidine reductase
MTYSQPGDPGNPIEGHVMTEEEQIAHALEILQEHGTGVQNRGDSFDIGNNDGIMSEEDYDNNDENLPMENPLSILSQLNLTPQQAENIKSLLVGGGTSAVHKFLSKHLGNEVAGALGGFLSGYMVNKIQKNIGRR